MANINKNIIMQAGAAVANATNKAAGLSAATPEPGSIISAIQLVNGGRTIGPDALAHFTESVRNKLLSLLVRMAPIQSGEGDPSPDNVRPISGRTGLSVYVGPTQDQQDATTYAVDWTTPAGTVYGGTMDVVTGVLTVDWARITDLSTRAATVETINNLTCVSISLGDIKTGANNTGVLSSVFFFAGNTAADTVEGGMVNRTGQYYNLAFCSPSNFTTVAEFRTFVSENNVDVVYKLATPPTYQLTAQEVVTLVGDNYIWSDSGDVTITE